MYRLCAMSVLLSILSLLITISGAVDCHDAGILIDIHSRQVNGRADIFRYGLSIGLGTPSQNNSLWPSITHNETTFSAPDYCVADSSSECLDGTRGFFSTDNSSSWRTSSSYNPLDDTMDYGSASSLYGQDTLAMWRTEQYGGPETLTPLDRFPVVVLSKYSSFFGLDTFYGPGGILGLGSASSILNKLFDQGKIAARSYGLYLGPSFDSTGDQRSGSLVLGGYDAGRFNGPVVPYNLVPAQEENGLSPFKITISDVTLITSGGETVVPLADNSFDAYLTTDSRPLQFPSAVITKLARALNAEPANNEERTFKLDAKFEGNLTMTLSNGLTIVFDSDWMTDSTLTTPISTGPDANSSFAGIPIPDVNPVTFGAAFLTRAYMFVNYDANPPNFAVAQALPDVMDIQQRPYCPHDIPVSAALSGGHSGAASRKALVGGLCGGLLGGILVLAAIWFFFGSRIRKYLRRNDPRLRSDNDSYFDRPSIKQTFHYWKSKNWKTIIVGNNKGNADYVYKDVESGLKAQPHVSALMYTSLSHDRPEPIHSFPKPSYISGSNERPRNLSRESSQDGEKELITITLDDKPASPLKSSPLDTSYAAASNFILRASRSFINGVKAPRLISAFNTNPQTESSHSRNASKTLSDGYITASTKIPIIGVRTSQEFERQPFDKSLPPTPAPSTPRSLRSRLSQATFPQSELEASSVDPTPRLPSLAFTPTNITFKPPTSPVPPIPAIPIGYTSNASKINNSPPDGQPHDQIDSLAVEFPEPTPISAVTTYSLWRNKTTKSNILQPSITEETTLSNASPQKPSIAPSIVSSTRSRSKTRAAMAMTARLSRFKDRQQTGVREIIIRKRARSRSKSRNRALVDLSAFADAPDSYEKLNTITTITSHNKPSHTFNPSSEPRFLIKRKALNKAATLRSLRPRAISGVSPCISATEDDLLVGLNDRAISPVSSMGRGRDFDLEEEIAMLPPPPPVPPFPPGLYANR